jgi:hypothetical protein
MEQQNPTVSKMERVQTAVEWLVNNLPQRFKNIMLITGDKIIEQAKAMEKEQIINTYLNACARLTPYGNYNDSAEQYYNETYNK